MKYLIFNRKSLLFATLMATVFGLNAQIESKHTDEKYNYTTVVYKDSTATDAAVLSALENSVGMGDVIRVTIAPPKPAVAPQVDKSKGEDTWLKPARTTATMTASAIVVPINNIPAKTVVAAPKLAPVRENTKPAAETQKLEVAPDPLTDLGVATEETAAVASATKTVRSKSSVSSKSAKKSSKKSVKRSVRKKKRGYKMKRRKPGKQRYNCPKF